MAGTPLTLRIRTKNGMFKLQKLTSNCTINDLKKAISDLTGIQYSLIKILKGYPPKFVENHSNDTLSSIYLKDGDLLTIEEGTSTNSILASQPIQLSKTSSITSTNSINEPKEMQKLTPNSLDGILLRKVVPANNSCLFTSVNYVIEDGKLDLDCQKFMRELIAQTVKLDETFNEGVLGKKKNEYCDW